MTMYVWLRLLAFGFALLDLGVSDSSTPGNSTPEPIFASATGSPATTEQTSINATTVPTTTKQPCGDKYAHISVTYHHNGNGSFTAIPEVAGGVKISPYENLEACNITSVTIPDDSCSPPKKRLELYVPPDPASFQLRDCVQPERANTFICLTWEETKPNGLTCDEERFHYTFKCDNITQSEKQFESDGFKPNEKYTCTAKIVYGDYEVIEKTETIQTDFGPPDPPKNLKCSAQNASAAVVTWEHPSNIFHGYILNSNASGNLYRI